MPMRNTTPRNSRKILSKKTPNKLDSSTDSIKNKKLFKKQNFCLKNNSNLDNISNNKKKSIGVINK